MLLEQVRAHNHAHVGKGQEELVVLVEGSQGRRNIAVHHAHIDDLAGVDVSIVRRSNHRGGAGVVIADVGQPCAAWVAVVEGKADETTPIDDQVRSQTAVIYTGDSVRDRKSTRLNSSHVSISYAVFCLKKKNNIKTNN